MAEDTTTKEIEVKLGDGTVVKGKDMEEAFANVAKMKVDTAFALREKESLLNTEKTERERISSEYERLKIEKEALEARLKPVEKTPTGDKAFNKDTYFQLLGEDPMKAQDYVDSYRFGIDSPDKVRETFNGMRENVDRVVQQVDVFTQQSVTASFLAQHPEYPQGDADAAKLLTQRVNELTTREGFPYNPSTLEFAYFQLVNNDKIKPVEEQTATAATVTESANPALSGTGASGLDMSEVNKAENMSDADLMKLLQSKGMFR